MTDLPANSLFPSLSTAFCASSPDFNLIVALEDIKHPSVMQKSRPAKTGWFCVDYLPVGIPLAMMNLVLPISGLNSLKKASTSSAFISYRRLETFTVLSISGFFI